MTDIMPKILEFMKTAGEIAMANYGRAVDKNFKSGGVFDLVTESDISINNLFNKFVAENFSDLDYIVIDEEGIGTAAASFDEINKHEYQFVIDPIDGTLPYALEIPMFGISVGVLCKGFPLMGAVYAPALGELVYGDMSGATWIKNMFRENEIVTQLQPRDIDKKALVLNMEWFMRSNKNIDFKRDLPANFYSAVVHMIYLATGRGRCHYFGALIWDMAGAWVVLKYLGFEFMNFETGKILENLNADDFKSNFRIKTCHIICKPADFDHFKEIADLV